MSDSELFWEVAGCLVAMGCEPSRKQVGWVVEEFRRSGRERDPWDIEEFCWEVSDRLE